MNVLYLMQANLVFRTKLWIRLTETNMSLYSEYRMPQVNTFKLRYMMNIRLSVFMQVSLQPFGLFRLFLYHIFRLHLRRDTCSETYFTLVSLRRLTLHPINQAECF